MSWVTRERPKIQQFARACLIRQLVEPDVGFIHVPVDCLVAGAEGIGDTPCDTPGIERRAPFHVLAASTSEAPISWTRLRGSILAYKPIVVCNMVAQLSSRSRVPACSWPGCC